MTTSTALNSEAASLITATYDALRALASMTFRARLSSSMRADSEGPSVLWRRPP